PLSALVSGTAAKEHSDDASLPPPENRPAGVAREGAHRHGPGAPVRSAPEPLPICCEPSEATVCSPRNELAERDQGCRGPACSVVPWEEPMMTRHSRTRSRTTLAALVLTPLLLVAACGGDPAPAPTTPQAGKTSSGSGGPTVESPSGGDLCPSVDNLRDDTITSYASFGDIVGFDDEVAERVGTTWRHSIPVTLTNPISAQCMIQVGITVTGSGGSYMEDSVVAVLDAGASVNIQAFALEREFEFESDTKDASPTEDLDI